MIFTFLHDTSALNRINNLAAEPINLSNMTNFELMPILNRAKFVMLDPAILEEIHVVAHEFHLTNLNSMAYLYQV
jgi:hypothetical protein